MLLVRFFDLTGEPLHMVHRSEYWLMCMTRNEYEIFLRSRPLIHDDVMLVNQLDRIRDRIYIDVEKTLDGRPDGSHYPFAESIAVTALITLVAVREKYRIFLPVRFHF